MTKKRSLPRLTSAQFVSNRNDEVRSALNSLARLVLPHADLADFYVTDLVHDAIAMANMADGEIYYLIVTDCGTHLFTPERFAPNEMTYRAKFKITCLKHRADYIPRRWIAEAIK
jgi:hypothetical protein